MTGHDDGDAPEAPPPATGPAVPTVGSAVRDPARDRVGVVMAAEGPRLQLRPLGGGREWDADPDRVRLLTHAELLSARVAEVNARSRGRLERGGLSATPPPHAARFLGRRARGDGI
ncbi:hypothetical protein DTL70_08920 [Streptomyces diacarni]|uniref:Uncharacterized protein n=1 Tax=Streptomyces diacarni TaxID=2800381 RepID=A0A367F578_9ACTN|nr:hypothetical protein DTL70_08920 [Streptomyces diacarni]